MLAVMYIFVTLLRSPLALSGVSSKVLAPKPVWHVGDWFELKISHWRGYAVAALPDQVDWSPPFVKRYIVAGEDEFYGHLCYVLQETWQEQGKEGWVTHDSGKFFFRKTDLALLGYWRRSSIDKAGEYPMKTIGAPPWVRPDCGELGIVPLFPVLEGVQKINFQRLVDATGKPILPRTAQEHLRRPPPAGGVEQKGRENTVTWRGRTQNIIQIEADGFVCRWVPGQIWWAQSWQLPSPAPVQGGQEGKWVSFYRAALFRTSRDGLVDYPLPEAAQGGQIMEEP